jgi:ferredoxin
VTDQDEKKTRVAWRIEFNTETCSLCEMCVNRCPTKALFVRRADNKLEILFDSRLCNSCQGEMYCEFHCPENAVTVTQVTEDELPSEPTVLIAGEMAICQDCGNPFMPERKLATLLNKEKITPKSVQNYCPDCRRNHLMDSYLNITDQD